MSKDCTVLQFSQLLDIRLKCYSLLAKRHYQIHTRDLLLVCYSNNTWLSTSSISLHAGPKSYPPPSILHLGQELTLREFIQKTEWLRNHLKTAHAILAIYEWDRWMNRQNCHSSPCISLCNVTVTHSKIEQKYNAKQHMQNWSLLDLHLDKPLRHPHIQQSSTNYAFQTSTRTTTFSEMPTHMVKWTFLPGFIQFPPKSEEVSHHAE